MNSLRTDHGIDHRPGTDLPRLFTTVLPANRCKQHRPRNRPDSKFPEGRTRNRQYIELRRKKLQRRRTGVSGRNLGHSPNARLPSRVPLGESPLHADHRPPILEMTSKLDAPAGPLGRWAFELQQFDIEINYQIGSLNRVADILS